MSFENNIKKDYIERIVPALMKEFNYSTVSQVPVLKKIVINQGLGDATSDKKLIDIAAGELALITGAEAGSDSLQKGVSRTLRCVRVTPLRDGYSSSRENVRVSRASYPYRTATYT